MRFGDLVFLAMTIYLHRQDTRTQINNQESVIKLPENCLYKTILNSASRKTAIL